MASALVSCVIGCTTTPARQPGTVTHLSDQGFRESIQLPRRTLAEVETASTDTLRQWLLPGEAGLVSRHRFLRPVPPTWTIIVAFDGAGLEIAHGVCRYDGWFVSISPGDDPSQVTPFYRARVPQYVHASAGDCAEPSGGLSASSDAVGIEYVQALENARASYRAGRSRLRCEVAGPECEKTWLSLPPPTSASRCYDRPDCIVYAFGSLQAKIAGRERPGILLYVVPPPVF